MNRTKVFLAVALVAAILSGPGSALAQKGAPADPLAGFDEFLETAIAGFGVPGLAVSVVKDGRVIYEKGVGLRDVDRRLPVTPKTIFAIAIAIFCVLDLAQYRQFFVNHRLYELPTEDLLRAENILK